MHRLVVVPAAFAKTHIPKSILDAQTTAKVLEQLTLRLSGLDEPWTIDLCHVLFVS